MAADNRIDKIFPLTIYYGPQPNCWECEYHFIKEYDPEHKYLECLLGKLINLELCNEFYQGVGA